ncbi:MAG: hypothetical protein HY825_03225 [Acidobacteria bacterium]|nr:hypothetical protein [Acidobacteriota bacterium]
MPKYVPLIILAVAALGVGIFLLVRAAERRRREAWAQAAASLGFAFATEAPTFLAELAGFKVFSRGHSQKVRNLASGDSWEGTVHLADFRYVTGGGKSRATHDQTVCVLRLPGLALPHFYLRREVPVLDAIGEMLGGQDLDFPEDAAFSRTFVLQGEETDAVRALFDPVVRERLRGFADPRLHAEGRGDTVVVHRGRPIRPDSARELLEATAAIAALLRERAAAR